MRYTRLEITFFPIFLLTAISAGRLGALLLGLHPSSPSDWSQVAILSSGLLGCVWCHLLLVGRMAKTAAVAAAVASLSLGLERRRPVGRNSV